MLLLLSQISYEDHRMSKMKGKYHMSYLFEISKLVRIVETAERWLPKAKRTGDSVFNGCSILVLQDENVV